jgi:hypothetical protein
MHFDRRSHVDHRFIPRLACRDAAGEVGRVRGEVRPSLLDDDQELAHQRSFSFAGLPQRFLLAFSPAALTELSPATKRSAVLQWHHPREDHVSGDVQHSREWHEAAGEEEQEAPTGV